MCHVLQRVGWRSMFLVLCGGGLQISGERFSLRLYYGFKSYAISRFAVLSPLSSAQIASGPPCALHGLPPHFTFASSAHASDHTAITRLGTPPRRPPAHTLETAHHARALRLATVPTSMSASRPSKADHTETALSYTVPPLFDTAGRKASAVRRFSSTAWPVTKCTASSSA